MTQLPSRLYTAAGVRALDRYAIDVMGIPGIELMERAGLAVMRVVKSTWPKAKSLIIVCGLGNNAGDGYVVARLAQLAGYRVTICQVGDATKLRGDALIAAKKIDEAKIHKVPLSLAVLTQADLIIDALLGTGLDRMLEGEFLQAVQWVNASQRAVLAVDITSGLNADNGLPMGDAIRATKTITFIGLKIGQFVGRGPEYVGELVYDDLALPDSVFLSHNPIAGLINKSWVVSLLPKRNRLTHKGNYGHVLVVGGERGYLGAVRMAAEAAARVGSGLVSVATHPEHADLININRPELMSFGISASQDLEPLIAKSSVIVVGPGLGQSIWSESILTRVCASDRPLVLDADALNLLALKPRSKSNWVLTPHPGEAGRLLGLTAAEVQQQRLDVASQIQAKYGGVCVLKGVGTLIHDVNQDIVVCPLGNPGMATGGMGDVLSGVIAGLMAQNIEINSAAKLGVYLHARAADIAAMEGERGLLATDLMAPLRKLVNPTQFPDLL